MRFPTISIPAVIGRRKSGKRTEGSAIQANAEGSNFGDDEEIKEFSRNTMFKFYVVPVREAVVYIMQPFGKKSFKIVCKIKRHQRSRGRYGVTVVYGRQQVFHASVSFSLARQTVSARSRKTGVEKSTFPPGFTMRHISRIA